MHNISLLAGILCLLSSAAPVQVLLAQTPTGSPVALTLSDALDSARRYNPRLRAATEAVTAASSLERQAAAFPNPTLAWAHEQLSRSAGTDAEDIVRVEQELPLAQRSPRIAAARLRREAAEARLQGARSELDFSVARAYATAVAADRRASLAAEAADAFRNALRASEQRLAAGDISGYAHRRLRLEAARYDVLRAASALDSRARRLDLAAMIASSPASIGTIAGAAVLADSLPASVAAALEIALETDLPAAIESLLANASSQRGELRASLLEARAAEAEAELARRARIPVPTLVGGSKTERVAGEPGRASGLVAGMSLPVPLWNRSSGTIAAAESEARRLGAESEIVRRRVVHEVIAARDALRAALDQTARLEPGIGEDSRRALVAAQTAYAEGEITLLEWLDAVRAYQETNATLAGIAADVSIRVAELERATGVQVRPLNGGVTR
jgi:outer membrane protein, heavy metal efflux system